jgi:hypothetical protein
MERDQLPDEDGGKGLLGSPARPKEPLLRADEGDCDALRRQLSEIREEVGVRAGVGDDEVRGAKSAPV